GRVPAERRFSDLIAVIKATGALRSAGDASEAMAIFARELTLLFDASACLISTFDPKTHMVNDWAAHVLPPAKLSTAAEDYPPDDYPTTKRVVTELVEASTTIGDGGDPAQYAFPEDIGFRANLLAPLVMGTHARGLIELLDTRRRVFTAEERQFCRLLSAQAGIVLGAAPRAHALGGQQLTH